MNCLRMLLYHLFLLLQLAIHLVILVVILHLLADPVILVRFIKIVPKFNLHTCHHFTSFDFITWLACHSNCIHQQSLIFSYLILYLTFLRFISCIECALSNLYRAPFCSKLPIYQIDVLQRHDFLFLFFRFLFF